MGTSPSCQINIHYKLDLKGRSLKELTFEHGKVVFEEYRILKFNPKKLAKKLGSNEKRMTLLNMLNTAFANNQTLELPYSAVAFQLFLEGIQDGKKIKTNETIIADAIERYAEIYDCQMFFPESVRF